MAKQYQEKQGENNNYLILIDEKDFWIVKWLMYAIVVKRQFPNYKRPSKTKNININNRVNAHLETKLFPTSKFFSRGQKGKESFCHSPRYLK